MTAISDNSDPIASQNKHAHLERLLNIMIEQPERRAEITKEIEETFGQEKAVLVLDMSGFSRTTQRYGIVAFLLMIHQMKLVARPIVDERRGLIVKADADNLFCLFDTVLDAVEASQEIRSHLNTANLLLPEESRLYISVGIGYGQILNLGEEDLYGDEVNLASKLGEDVAQMGDILLTAAAHARLESTDISVREESISISGLTLVYYSVQDR